MNHSSNQNINKSTFLDGLVCQTLAWHNHRGQSEPPTVADLLRIKEGQEIGRRAHSLFPDGILVSDRNIKSAVQRTQELIEDPDVNVIFEAAFIADGFVARADILKREGSGWHLLEVKASLNDKPELVEDLAYTAMVLTKAVIRLKQASLVLMSKDYRLGMSDEDLFILIEKTDEVNVHIAEYSKTCQQVKKAVRAKKCPKSQLIFECKGCGYFQDECFNDDIEHHIFELPRISRTKFDNLNQLSITSISDIPDEFNLTPAQHRVRQSVVAGNPIYNRKDLSDFLSKVVWPAYYLDFETMLTALPLYPDIAPYEQVPTQYSLHIYEQLSKEIAHKEYLADPSRDCRRELTKRLLDDLGEMGSIIVYSSFEKTILNSLAALFLDLEPRIEACIDRLFDLHTAFTDYFCHPNFHGRTSIKKTLPVLVPLTYDGLTIADGGTAMAQFARMAKGECSPDEIEEIRRDLLAYCKLDTLAMVKLHEALLAHVQSR